MMLNVDLGYGKIYAYIFTFLKSEFKKKSKISEFVIPNLIES